MWCIYTMGLYSAGKKWNHEICMQWMVLEKYYTNSGNSDIERKNDTLIFLFVDNTSKSLDIVTTEVRKMKCSLWELGES